MNLDPTTLITSGAIVIFLGFRVALTDLWLGIAGALVSMLVILSTSALCRLAVELIEPDRIQHPSEIDPLTGLLNREAFDMHTATMLGSQRTTVNEAAQALQKSGAIAYSRGRITVLDRAALERVACECYRAADTFRWSPRS